MTLDEAKKECERWLSYLEAQKERSVALQKLATERRAGKCSKEEAWKRLSTIDHHPVVYDGAELAEAVKVLLKECSSVASK